jgi:hypothetical protein
VKGCALLGGQIGYYIDAARGPPLHGAFGTSTLPGNGVSALTPLGIDPRLAAIAQTYQYYAFRKVTVRYIPFVGTSTGGGLYLGISKDSEQAFTLFNTLGEATGSSSGTAQDIMDLDPAVMAAVWQPQQLTFEHNGVKLWETFPNGEEPELNRIQALIVAGVNPATPVTIASQNVYGHLWVEYEIDFYIPGPPHSSN